MGITVKDKESGEQRRVDCACKVWAAGVQASPLGEVIAAQCDGTEIDRSGVSSSNRTSPSGAPERLRRRRYGRGARGSGVAQGAIQGAKYAAKTIKHTVKGTDDPANRVPFKYFDKGSMATISGTMRWRRSEARIRRLHRLAGLAVPPPSVPGRVQEPDQHAVQLDHHLHLEQPGSAGHHQPVGLRASRAGGRRETAAETRPRCAPDRRATRACRGTRPGLRDSPSGPPTSRRM